VLLTELFRFDRFYGIYTVIFLEATSLNEGRDIFGGTHPVSSLEDEARLFTISPGISIDSEPKFESLNLESTIVGNKGM